MGEKLPEAPTLYVLTGPTAVGKTDLAIQWALENDAEIISCDSMLIYKGMDIGTAKPSLEEMKLVKHYCIDVQPVKEPFSIKKYQTIALAAVEAILAKGKKVLITGGSGFYLKSFFEAVVDDIPIPPSISKVVSKLYTQEGLASVVHELKKRNPLGTGNLDLQNPRKVIKALERCMTTHKSILDLRKQFEKLSTPFDKYTKKTCLLMRSPESLAERIRLRVKKMIKIGLVREVIALMRMGIFDNPNAASAIGYRETIHYIESRTSEEELEASIVKNTVRFVRKQRTWFRHQFKADVTINLDETEKPDLQTLFDLASLEN